MFRATIDIDHTSNVDSVLNDLARRAAANGLPAEGIQQLETVARESIEPLVRNGAELARIGSKMNAVRKVAGPGYALEFRFNAGTPSLLSRLIRAIRGQ